MNKQGNLTPSTDNRPLNLDQPLRRQVLLIIHDPTIPSEGDRKLHQVFGWNNPDELAQQYIQDLRECSYGFAEYQVLERIVVDAFPVKADGFVYTPKTYLASWRARSGFHMPDEVDYHRLLSEFDILRKVQQGEIDEVWLFGFPYGGYYESVMAGPGAFWCNAPPLPRTNASTTRFVIMGFNYERGVGEMLESFGHRSESIMARVFREKEDETNLWKRFTRYHKTHPGQAEVGNIHFAPNSQRDYDWGNTRLVPSFCDNWYDPHGHRRPARMVNCREWGNGDIRLHHMWWFRHLPHFPGSSGGISHNWWLYLLDPSQVPETIS